MNIPEHHLQFCREVAALAALHKVEEFTLSFQPNYSDTWHNKITMHWSQGRHGEDSREVKVTSTVNVITRLTK